MTENATDAAWAAPDTEPAPRGHTALRARLLQAASSDWPWWWLSFFAERPPGFFGIAIVQAASFDMALFRAWGLSANPGAWVQGSRLAAPPRERYRNRLLNDTEARLVNAEWAGARPLGTGGLDVAIDGPADPAAPAILEWLNSLPLLRRVAWCVYCAVAELDDGNPEGAVLALRMCCTEMPDDWTGYPECERDAALDALEGGLHALGVRHGGERAAGCDTEGARAAMFPWLQRHALAVDEMAAALPAPSELVR